MRTAGRKVTKQLRYTKEIANRQLESYRLRVSAAEIELATLRGRSDRLAEEIALSSGRIRQLEVELLREREATAALLAVQLKALPPSRRFTTQRLRATVPVRRRKL